MKIEITDIQTLDYLGTPLSAFQAAIHINDKHVAYVGFDGNHTIRVTPITEAHWQIIKEADQFLASDPRLRAQLVLATAAAPGYYLGQYTGDRVVEKLKDRNLSTFDKLVKEQSVNAILYGKPLTGKFSFAAFKRPIANLLQTDDGQKLIIKVLHERVFPKMKQGDSIFNTNIPDSIIEQAKALAPDGRKVLSHLPGRQPGKRK